MDEELERAQGLLAAGDVPGLIRHLRTAGETLPLGEVARLLAAAARSGACSPAPTSHWQ